MFEYKALVYFRLSKELGKVGIASSGLDGALEFPDFVQDFNLVSEDAEQHGMHSVSAQIRRFYEALRLSKAGDVSHRTKIVKALDELAVRIEDELAGRLFFAIEFSSQDLILQKHPQFGDNVELRFPAMSEDIAEAAKCLALDRYTACVFHLMRVMELAVQQIGKKVTGIDLSDRKWGSIENEIRNYKDSLLPFSNEKALYCGMLIHLGLVRVAWRNEVMHPKQTYTKEEAKRVYDATKSFIQDLTLLF